MINNTKYQQTLVLPVLNGGISRQKIAIIGSGTVGAAIAYTIAIRELVADIILIDIDKEKQKGEALDINDALSFLETRGIENGNFIDAASADIIILTAGEHTYKDRLDLAAKNKIIISDIFNKIGPIKSTAIIIVVSNPVDVITYLAQELSGLPNNQVFGTGTCLDSARLRSNLAKRFNINPIQICGFVLAEHGNSEFIAWSTVSIAGKKICDLLSQQDMKQIENEVKNEAAEIKKYKKATCYGIAMVTADIVKVIFLNENKVLPVSNQLSNYYGISDVCLGTPVIVGRSGIIKSWPIDLNKEEITQLKKSADIIKMYKNQS